MSETNDPGGPPRVGTRELGVGVARFMEDLEEKHPDREIEAERLRAKLGPAYDAFQEREAEAREAKERAEEAGGERRRAGGEDGPGAGRAEGGGVKDSSYEARQERRDRERQAGEAFQKILRERVEDPGPRLEDLMGRGKRESEGGDDAR